MHAWGKSGSSGHVLITRKHLYLVWAHTCTGSIYDVTWTSAIRFVMQDLRKPLYIVLLVFDTLLAYRFIFLALYRKEIYILTKAAIIHACHLSLYTNLYAVTLFITFTSIALSPSPAPFSPQQIFTTVAVISYVRRETVLVFMFQLMKISDFSVAMKRIQV